MNASDDVPEQASVEFFHLGPLSDNSSEVGTTSQII